MNDIVTRKGFVVFMAALLSIMVPPGMARAKGAECGKAEKLLGTLEGKDDLNGKVYSFAVCHDEKKGAVVVHAYPVTGTRITASNLPRIAKKAENGVALWGEPYKPAGKEDKRRVEYRVHLKGSKATKLEIYLVTLNKDGSAKKARTLSVAMPCLGKKK